MLIVLISAYVLMNKYQGFPYIWEGLKKPCPTTPLGPVIGSFYVLKQFPGTLSQI